MKKFLILLCALLMILLTAGMPMAAFAVDVDVPVTGVGDIPVDVTALSEPFTWSYLATIGGASAFALIVVQFLKAPLDKVWKIPTRFLVYIITLVTMLAATTLTTGLNIDGVLLAAVNALLAATAAYGMYELTFAKHSK